MPGWSCDECGFESSSIDPLQAGETFASLADQYGSTFAHALARPDADTIVRQRPEPDVWSALEYAAHAADCYGLFIDGLTRARAGEVPLVGIIEQDQLMIAEGHNRKPAAEVLERLATTAREATELGSTLTAADCARPVSFRWGRSELSVLTWGTVHEVSHHLADVEAVLLRATEGVS